MNPLSRVLDRVLPALLMASSVVLLSAGLFSYAPLGGDPSPSVIDAGDPNFPASPTPAGPTADGPTPTASAAPSATPTLSLPVTSPSTLPTLAPSPSAPDGPTPPASATPGTPGTPLPTLPPGGAHRATRIVVPSLGIDLPVVAGDIEVAGNEDGYPLCDVAQYLVEYSQPGEPGTTYLYAHARTGMFLPLLEGSRRNDGRAMIGALVEVYTSDDRLHLYEIHVVKRHATDLTLAHQLPPAGHQLIMQTSEGPRGTVPKLQVAARPLGVIDADPAQARPQPRPRPCG